MRAVTNCAQTSWQQEDHRNPLDLAGLPSPQKARVRPRVLLGHVDDGECINRLAPHAELELAAVDIVTVGCPVSVVGSADVLRFAAAGDDAVPGDHLAGEGAAVAVDLEFGLAA